MSDEPVPAPPGGQLADDGLAARGLDAPGLDGVVHAVRELLEVAGTRPSRLEVRSGGLAVHLEWPAAAPAAGGPPASAAEIAGRDAWHYFCSPLVGVFYRAREPGAEPFVEVGDGVAAGQQIAIIEAMKLMLPVEADRDGVISELLQADGTPVEYGTRLFAVELAGMP